MSTLMTGTSENLTDIQRKVEELQRKLEQKTNECQHLANHLKKYESAASGANDGLWDWDFTTNEAFVSDPWKLMLGIPADEKLDPNAWELLLHPEDRDQTISAFKKFIDGNVDTYNKEFRLLHRDGSYRWINSRAKAFRDEKSKALRISGSHTDITDRKLAAEFIKRSEAKYRNLFENSLVAMFRMKVDTGEITDANGKLKNMVEKEQVIGKSFYDFFSSKLDRDNLNEQLCSNENVENLEIQLTTADENLLWVSFSGVHYKEDKEVDCVLKDITQTKENLLELQKVNFELDSFVYHASHDLRSPLRSVLGLIDLYRMEETASIKEECIEKIESSVKRLDHLVMDLLSISRNDRVNEPTREINMMNEVNSSIASYYNASNTKNLEILCKVHQTVKFLSDLTRVRIILNNLISNAIKYRSFHKERSYISIEITVTQKEAVIRIEDNGEGIEENKLPNIFDMFFRATEKSEGSGLGLYIVKKVADKLNADIKVDSVELEGTTFTLTIPNMLNSMEVKV